MIKFETQRLIVRDYTGSDLDGLHRLMSDKENMYYLDDIATDTLAQSKGRLDYAAANADGHYFCICEKDTGDFVGSVGYTYTAHTPIGKIGHMGYFILPAFQRRGYTPEAAACALRFAFEKDGCIRITIAHYKDNIPSGKVIVRLGFRKEAEQIKAQYHDGVMKDRVEYAINKDEWPAIEHSLTEGNL
ncbi:MAG: GNAT family N-acetyltransferase [Oscillospiraceae bacterium]|nr:GNAT family N-acetyltransferase [Oscillospiraceae bacterium]